MGNRTLVVKFAEGQKIAKFTERAKRTQDLPRAKKTTHLSEKSTSKMSHSVQELNKKVLHYINNL
ncbi:hypothetical protein ACFFIX_18675 [Metabacillus herbersteinensis]|uniref:Uncharacterized protein n=1 Tax=Metabacillus herbersteinensis TaxID=283816 RepID=A0ABV6GJX8_9BACI